jgi:glycosyltransferase involved in cell wall biosynthesis
LNKQIVILGTAHPFRGGITTFNERLARQLQTEGNIVTIYNFSLQYPSFMFPGKTQYSTESPPANLTILSKLNSISPLNWLKVGNELHKLKPDILIVRYWLPLMAPALGTVLRRVKKNHHTKIIAITDNVIPHEKRIGDVAFTKYFVKPCDAFITMSDKVSNDLKKINHTKKAIQVLHPLYDSFGAMVNKQVARQKLGLLPQQKVLLFFGFIRKYKGLDMLLQAVAILKNENKATNIKLVIAGEFYENENDYRQLIKTLGINDMLLLKNDFVNDANVRYYFGAADVVVQPYRNATQSGVTPLAYHFEKPMIVTRVGALPDYVPNGKAGIVCEPNAAAIANAITEYFEKSEDYFLPALQIEKQKYSWHKFAETILQLAGEI